jgi:hypothetical protein
MVIFRSYDFVKCCSCDLGKNCGSCYHVKWCTGIDVKFVDSLSFSYTLENVKMYTHIKVGKGVMANLPIDSK